MLRIRPKLERIIGVRNKALQIAIGVRKAVQKNQLVFRETWSSVPSQEKIRVFREFVKWVFELATKIILIAGLLFLSRRPEIRFRPILFQGLTSAAFVLFILLALYVASYCVRWLGVFPKFRLLNWAVNIAITIGAFVVIGFCALYLTMLVEAANEILKSASSLTN